MKKYFSLMVMALLPMVACAQLDIFPPLGIEKPDIPFLGSKGSRTYKEGKQGDVRTKVMEGTDYPINKEATRFLEKAVKENNVINAEKFLKAGASAFISYEMIDKKQYEMIDLMYKDNPKLIRYSQLLHYACAKSDTKMIDFLIERNASLDLYGYYLQYNKDAYYGEGGYELFCGWNKDGNFKNTPADAALYYRKWDNLNHIINKYHKYPTIYGCCIFLGLYLRGDKPDNDNLKFIRGFISGEDSRFQFMKSVDYKMADVLNFGYHHLHNREVESNYLMNDIVAKIAESRRVKDNRDKEYLAIMNLMIDKGADVNCQNDNGAFWRKAKSVGINIYNYVNTTPIYVAMTNKNMMDVVKLLRSKGASLTTTVNGKTASILKLPKVLDEYKEYFMLEGIQ